MRLVLSVLCLWSCMTFNPLCSQSDIILEGGPISYTNIKGVEMDEYVADISDCTSFAFSLEFSFSQDWAGSTNPSNMEAADECGFGTCPGDPTDPSGGTCDNCWDFMWIESEIGGSVFHELLLGFDQTTPQSGTYISTAQCTDGETEALIRITNQNWASIETNTFENVTLVCWEGTPEVTPFDPICAGADLTLDGDAVDSGVVTDWEWTTTGSASIADDAAQSTTASGAQSGDVFTLTTTDDNGCTASAEETVTLGGSFDATLQGGSNLCPNSCTQDGVHVEVALSGGVEPYELALTFNGLGPFVIPGLNIDETVFQICHTDGGAPDIDLGSNPIVISLPQFAWDLAGGSLNIELLSVVDDSGCSGTINVGMINLALVDEPFIEEPNVQALCTDPGTLIDLTQYDNEILDGQGCEVRWLEDMDDVTAEVDDPTAYDVDADGNTVYAVVFCDPCFSPVVEVVLDLLVRPEIDITEPSLFNCGPDFILPDFMDVADIINENDPEYFLTSDGSGQALGPGDIIFLSGVTEIFIFDFAGPNCFASASFMVEPLIEPQIDSPSGSLSACGSITLPEPVIFNEDDWEYNTSPDGTGQQFFDDDIIMETNGITLLYLIATTNDGCRDTTEVRLDFISGIDYSANVAMFSCDTLFLSDIQPIPTNPEVGFYTDVDLTNTVPDFTSMDTITFTQAQTGPGILDTLYLYDPTAQGPCATIDTFVFEIGATPQIINPGDRTFCESGTLAGILDESTADVVSYFDEQGNMLDLNTPITSSTRIDVTAWYITGQGLLGCLQELSFRVNIVDRPSAGNGLSFSVCEGHVQTFDFVDLLGADLGGLLIGPMGNPDFDWTDPTMIDLSLLPLGQVPFTYAFNEPGCPQDEATIMIDVVPPPDAGTDANLTTCDIDTPIDLVALLGNPADLGSWIATDLGDITNIQIISDPTSFVLADLPGTGQGFIIEHTTNNANADFCTAITAIANIEVIDQLSAGENGSTSICKGTVLDLNTLLSSDADLGGTWESADNLIFIGNTWDTGPTPLGLGPDFEWSYIIESNGCPSDTATFILTVTNELSAGTQAADNSFCEGDQVNLETVLDGETTGGEFFSILNPAVPIDEIWTATTSSEFTYIIPALPGCEADTTDFVVQVFPPLSASASLSTDMLCEQDCAELVVTTSEMGQVVLDIFGDTAAGQAESILYELSSGANTFTLCADGSFGSDGPDVFNLGEGESFAVNITEVTSDLIDCQRLSIDRTEMITIGRSHEVMIDTTICEGADIVVDGVTYDRSTMVNGVTVLGCDSIINITIKNYPPADSVVDVTLCEGQEFLINGDILTRPVVDSTITLTGGASNGCDSIVQLNLSFDQFAPRNFIERLCYDEDRMINGTIYNVDNPTDTIVLPLAASGGCDSIIQINLEFSPEPVDDLFTPATCDDIDYIINGETYNFANPQGMEILTNTQGCDSVFLEIDIMSLASEPVPFVRNICVDTVFIINGTPYDGTTMTTGIEVATNQNGCDSIINVEINLSSEIREDFTKATCDDEDYVIGQDTFNFANPTGVVMLKTAQDCDSIITVMITELFPSDSLFERELCESDPTTFDVNGTPYGIANPDGTEFFEAANGCDSVVTISIIPLMEDFTLIAESFCNDTTIMVGSETFDRNQPSGIVPLINVNGCDSIVEVDLDFSIPSASLRFCPTVDGAELFFTTLDGLALPATAVVGGVTYTVTELPFFIDELAAGSVSYEITGANGCMFTDSFDVMADSDATVSISADEVSPGVFDLQAETAIDAIEYNWEGSSAALSCTDCPDPTLTTTEETTTTVTLLTANGCLYTASITLTPEEDTPPPPPPAPPTEQDSTVRIYMPTIIQLSSSTEDRFFPSSSVDGFIIDALTIYDRWGNQVFVNRAFVAGDSSNGWNPDLDYRVEQGVYVYVMEYVDPVLGRLLDHGTITVIR